jgi:hypothetical protein
VAKAEADVDPVEGEDAGREVSPRLGEAFTAPIASPGDLGGDATGRRQRGTRKRADRREEDGGSLVIGSDPLTERLKILGSPSADFDLSVNQPVAMVTPARQSRLSLSFCTSYWPLARPPPKPVLLGVRERLTGVGRSPTSSPLDAGGAVARADRLGFR